MRLDHQEGGALCIQGELVNVVGVERQHASRTCFSTEAAALFKKLDYGVVKPRGAAAFEAGAKKDSPEFVDRSNPAKLYVHFELIFPGSNMQVRFAHEHLVRFGRNYPAPFSRSHFVILPYVTVHFTKVGKLDYTNCAPAPSLCSSQLSSDV